MPKVMVGQYERQLRQLITTLSDYRGKRKYPNSWPADLSAYEIVIEALVLKFQIHCFARILCKSKHFLYNLCFVISINVAKQVL